MYKIRTSMSTGFRCLVKKVFLYCSYGAQMSLEMSRMTIREEIARRIRERREYLWRQHGQHTQAYVADQIGVTRPTYGRWESGEISVTVDALVKLATILGVDVPYFYVGGTPHVPTPTPTADQIALPQSVYDFFSDDTISQAEKDAIIRLIEVRESERKRAIDRERAADQAIEEYERKRRE